MEIPNTEGNYATNPFIQHAVPSALWSLYATAEDIQQ